MPDTFGDSIDPEYSAAWDEQRRIERDAREHERASRAAERQREAAARSRRQFEEAYWRASKGNRNEGETMQITITFKDREPETIECGSVYVSERRGIIYCYAPAGPDGHRRGREIAWFRDYLYARDTTPTERGGFGSAP